MNIIAIDDEPLQLRLLLRAIEEASPTAEIESFSDPETLLMQMEEKQLRPDVAFLDIELPVMSGIELARKIKIFSPGTWVVFVTGFSQYAVEAYEIHARGYVMKPVTADRIRRELEIPEIATLRKQEAALVQVKCFGDFEVFAQGEPIRFERSKTKELLAYLIDRNGAALNTGTLCAVLWEDQPDTLSLRNYFRKLVVDLSKTLAGVGAREVFIKNRNSFAVDVSKVDCDYYRFLKRDPDAVNTYNGEYMSQYSWAELTLGGL